jgi:hypothetical protein
MPPQLQQYLREHDRGIIFSLILLACAVYLPFINNPFIFDDLSYFSGGNPVNFLNQDFEFRPRYFPYATLSVIWSFFLDIPVFYHLVSLLVHCINTIVLFYFLNRLLIDSSSGNKKHMWMGAAIYAVHPVATYAVGYTVQLSILMATLFTLSTFLSFIKGLLSQKYIWFLWSVIFYFLAVFSKEHSITAPAITVALCFLFRNEFQANKKAIALTWISYIAITILLSLSFKGILGNPYEHDATMLFSTQKIDTGVSLHTLSILNQCGLFFKYLFLWVIPNPAWMSIDIRPTFENYISVGSILKGIAFIGYGGTATYLLIASRKRLIGFSLLYPWIFFLVDLSTIRIQEPFVLYRCYLWMPGMLVLISILLSGIRNNRAFNSIAGFILIILIASSWNRLWVMGNEYRLWNDAAILLDNQDTPGAARIYYNRGKALLTTKEWALSIGDFQRVIDIHPEIHQAHLNMGIAYYNLKLTDKALDAFNMSIDINPDNAPSYFGRAMALKRLGQAEVSEKAFKKACDLGHQASCIIISFSNQQHH